MRDRKEGEGGERWNERERKIKTREVQQERESERREGRYMRGRD